MSATAIINLFATHPERLYKYLESVGLTRDDMALVTGDTLWLPEDCKRAHTALTEIIFGPLRLAQFDDINLPYQYVGKIIAEFVHPFNRMTACQLFKRTYDRAELQAHDDGFLSEMTPIKPTRLFAFVEEWVMENTHTKLREELETLLKVAPKVKQR